MYAHIGERKVKKKSLFHRQKGIQQESLMAFLFILTLPGKSKIGEIRNNKEDMKSENIKQELWKDAFSFLCKIRYLSTTLQAAGHETYYDWVQARCIASYMYDHPLLCLRDRLSQSGYLPCTG